jgi:hypothetical protein
MHGIHNWTRVHPNLSTHVLQTAKVLIRHAISEYHEGKLWTDVDDAEERIEYGCGVSTLNCEPTKCGKVPDRDGSVGKPDQRHYVLRGDNGIDQVGNSIVERDKTFEGRRDQSQTSMA